MTGLNQIRGAILKTLADAGIDAAAAWDRTAGEIGAPFTVVDVSAASEAPVALGGYLGQSYDEAAGTIRELYGRQMTATVSLQVRAATAAACESGTERVSDALMCGGLPSGLRPGEETWEAVEWDKTNRCFLRRGTLKCRAYFTASASDGEESTLLDFTLKGVLFS